MKKSDIVNYVCESIDGLKPKQCARIIRLAFDYIRDALVSGENVKVKYFGTFTVKTCAKHTGINPQTKEQIEIPEKRRVILKLSKGIKRALN